MNINWLKWENKIQPLALRRSQTGILGRNGRNCRRSATDNFFNLLLSQISLPDCAKKCKTNSDTLYKIAQDRFAEGTMPENELLQMELSLMNSRQNLEQTTLDVEGKYLAVKSLFRHYRR